MFEEVVRGFITAVGEASVIEASKSSNILYVKLDVYGLLKEYRLTLGAVQSVRLPTNSRSMVWTIVDALHSYHSAPAEDLLVAIERETQLLETRGNYPLKTRMQALFFIAATGMPVTADESLMLAYLTHSPHKSQLALFKRLVTQMKASYPDAWKTFSTDSAESSGLRALVHELNLNVKAPIRSRILMSPYGDVLEWGLKSPVGDQVGRVQIKSFEAS